MRTKHISPLIPGDSCRVQNQTGRFPKRWDRTGIVVQAAENDQYVVKIAGSNRITLRNRKYLRRVEPVIPFTACVPTPHKPNTPPADLIQTTTNTVAEPPDHTDGDLPGVPNEPLHIDETPSENDIITNSYPTNENRPAAEHAAEPTVVTPPMQPPPMQPPPPNTERPKRDRRPPAWHTDYDISALNI